MNYNPYLSNTYGNNKSPQQMQEDYNRLMSQYSNMYNQNNNMQPNNQTNYMQNQNQNPALTEKGQYIKVTNFEEVQNYPTSLDGTASLFFDFANKVFWSKKFINGSHAVQAFKFEPINNAEPASKKSDDEIDYTKELADIVDPVDERFNKIEKMLESLMTKKTTSKPKKIVVEEDIKDEI